MEVRMEVRMKGRIKGRNRGPSFRMDISSPQLPLKVVHASHAQPNGGCPVIELRVTREGARPGGPWIFSSACWRLLTVVFCDALMSTPTHTPEFTLPPSHLLTLSPSHPLTLSASQPLSLSPSHRVQACTFAPTPAVKGISYLKFTMP